MNSAEATRKRSAVLLVLAILTFACSFLIYGGKRDRCALLHVARSAGSRGHAPRGVRSILVALVARSGVEVRLTTYDKSLHRSWLTF